MTFSNNIYNMNPQDSDILADVVFVIEGTALNGGYFHDIRNNYIIPTMEYFSPGIDECDYVPEGTNSLYGVVLFQASDCSPVPNCQTYGPFSNPQNLLYSLDRMELVGGRGETCAHVAEGLATALMCFEELQSKRDNNVVAQKHCILICNSPPYLVPVTECYTYANKTVDQLAIVLQEKGINLSIISPRKLLTLLKIFEKSGGDLSTLQTKNYAKDPRHLVLLKGFCLKERPISPSGNLSQANVNMTPTLLSPLSANDSPKPSGVPGSAPVMIATTTGPFRPNQNPGGMPNNMLGNNMGPIRQVNHMNGQFPNQQLCGSPSSYLGPNGMQRGPNPRGWMMPPQQRPPYMNNNQSLGQNSALISQLTTPSHTLQCGTQGSQNMMQNFQPNNQGGAPVGTPAPLAQPGVPVRERHTIWQGLLEWIEKAKTPSDQQKHTKHVPCQVSANSKDGEPELKADSWPSKLIMQLMPKQLIGNIGGQYLKDSKSVLFHPQPCEALESLTKVMSSGFAGCVHFTASTPAVCDIKVLILLYTAEKKAYLGFIPNNQSAFVERLRRVIQQQKQSQVLMRQGQVPAGPQTNMNSAPGVPSPGQLAGPTMTNTGNGQTAPSQPSNSQSGIMLSQTNTMAMGGGQITQNVVTTSSPNVVNAPRLGLMTMQQQQGANNMNTPNQNNMRGTQNMMGGAPQRPPFDHIEAARQQNLEKILHLKQTLEAAQQAEAQYKSQLEIYSHVQQIQESLQTAQHKEAQYKQQIDQEQRKQLQAQLQQMQQRGMNVPQSGSGPNLSNTMTGQSNLPSGMPGTGI